MLNSEL